ncbi:hypothetical protein V6N11_067602 [Hibiscus sabdariffa]|uniref:Uncharacterized protein n=1 Tax=Hibiscus sabdariffa TaxID=183260 RepID=A0ABR2SRJ1_9ROSI
MENPTAITSSLKGAKKKKPKPVLSNGEFTQSLLMLFKRVLLCQSIHPSMSSSLPGTADVEQLLDCLRRDCRCGSITGLLEPPSIFILLSGRSSIFIR